MKKDKSEILGALLGTFAMMFLSPLVLLWLWRDLQPTFFPQVTAPWSTVTYGQALAFWVLIKIVKNQVFYKTKL